MVEVVAAIGIGEIVHVTEMIETEAGGEVGTEALPIPGREITATRSACLLSSSNPSVSTVLFRPKFLLPM